MVRAGSSRLTPFLRWPHGGHDVRQADEQSAEKPHLSDPGVAPSSIPSPAADDPSQSHSSVDVVEPPTLPPSLSDRAGRVRRAALVTMTLGVAVGSVYLSPGAAWQVIVDHLAGHPKNTVADEIVWHIRLPRVLLAALVGAALTTAGTVVQALVRNALGRSVPPRGVFGGQRGRHRRAAVRGLRLARDLGDLGRQRARAHGGHGGGLPGVARADNWRLPS